MRYGVVADDITGACDTAAPFLAIGDVYVSMWPRMVPDDVTTISISTESRSAAAAQGRERSRQAAASLREHGVEMLYRKVDSQMRGNIGADLQGTLEAWPGAMILAPALPQEGRVTINGHQRWPWGDVDMVALLNDAGLRAKVGGPEDAAPGTVVVCDATSQADLHNIAVHVRRSRSSLVPAGSAGLATELAALFDSPPHPARGWPSCAHPVALVGSLAAATQARIAAARGKNVLILGPSEVPENLDAYDAAFVTGGETASRILHWLDVDRLDLRGELIPRAPVGICRGGPHDGLPFALKAGSFGTEDSIWRAMERLEIGA